MACRYEKERLKEKKIKKISKILGSLNPHYVYFFYLSSFFLIVVKEASLLWRAKFSVGSSCGVLDVNTFISI